jgi:hypothetical protein
VRPHDIVLSRPGDTVNGPDARLPGTALVRFMSALGRRVAIELLYEKRMIEAEITRETLEELGLRVRDKCAVRLRLPRIYAKREAERQTAVSERAAKRPLRKRLRVHLRPDG